MTGMEEAEGKKRDVRTVGLRETGKLKETKWDNCFLMFLPHPHLYILIVKLARYEDTEIRSLEPCRVMTDLVTYLSDPENSETFKKEMGS